MRVQTLGAGSGPKHLAQVRNVHSSAFMFAAIALLVLLVPLLSMWNSIPLWTYVAVLIAARLCYMSSVNYRKSAQRAENGGKAERLVAKKLLNLPPGWICEAGIYFEGTGDIDLFVTSPTGKAFVIDVKSHYGAIGLSACGSMLTRIKDGSESKFEKDPLHAVRGQAMRMERERNLQDVIPVLAFTKANVRCDQLRVDDVYVLEAINLIHILREIEAGRL